MKKAFVLAFAIALGGCSSVSMKPVDISERYNNFIQKNYTTETVCLRCVGNNIRNLQKHYRLKRIAIAVGDIPDLTGKYDYDEGRVVTNGAENMAITALHRINWPKVVDRTNLTISEYELRNAQARLLGDGKITRIGNNVVNYRLVKSGQIVGSDYYITGAITELDYNIGSGGQLLGISGVEAGKRVCIMNVAIDLKLTNTRTTVIVRNVSLKKRLVGYETTAGVFKFFGTELVTIDAGKKSNEPLHFAIRTIIEHGVADLVGSLYGLDTSKWHYNENYARSFQDEWITNPIGVANALCPVTYKPKVMKKRVRNNVSKVERDCYKKTRSRVVCNK